MAANKRVPSPYKRAGITVGCCLLAVYLTVDFRQVFLKSWMFEFLKPTHSVELNVSRIKLDPVNGTRQEP